MNTDPMEHLDDDKLQRYFDGDLTEGEATVVRREVEDSPMEQARIAQLEHLGELLRFSAEDVSADIDGDALFAKINAGVAKEVNPRLRVIEGAKQRKQTSAVVGVVLAIAAAVTLALLLQPTDESVAEHPMDDPRERIVLIDDPLPPVHVDTGGSEVVRIDFGSNTGTHFSVEGDRGQPLAVVWIDEEAP